MATVIDTLVVQLGLDPTKFTQGQADALAAFKKTREGAEREGKNIEATTKRVSDSISEFKSQVLGLTALVLGGGAIKGFLDNLTKTDAGLGRTANLLGLNVEELARWESAVKRVGGTTEGVRGTIGGLVGELQNITHGLPASGNVVQSINSLQAEAQRLGLTHINLIQAFSQKGPTEFLLQLSQVLSKLAELKGGGPNAAFYAKNLGIDEGTLNLLLQNRGKVEALLEEARRIGTPSAENVKQAQAFQSAWEGAAQAAGNILNDLGRMTRATEVLIGLTKSLSWWRTPEGRAEAEKQGEDLHDRLIRKFGAPGSEESRRNAEAAVEGRPVTGAGKLTDAAGTAAAGGWMDSINRFLKPVLGGGTLLGPERPGQPVPVTPVGPGGSTGAAGSPGAAAGSPAAAGSAATVGASQDLRTKPGAGVRSQSVDDLANMLQQDIPGLNRFTSFNDRYHTGFPSAHAQGRALDFTLNDPAQSAAVAAAVEAKLRALGVSATVLDEYKNPSSRATAGHIHVQFQSSAAADAFSAALRQAPPQGNAAAGAAGAANVSSIVNGQKTSTSTSTTKIDTLNVITPESTSPGIAKTIKDHIERQSMATQANYGAA